VLYMTGAWPDGDVDHINGDGADNRWANLRCVTHAENLWNAKKRKDNNSGYFGVSFARRERKWRAQIVVNKTYYSLGDHATAEGAARARDAAAVRLCGDKKRLNFPVGT
jgi:hypothetical protein